MNGTKELRLGLSEQKQGYSPANQEAVSPPSAGLSESAGDDIELVDARSGSRQISVSPDSSEFGDPLANHKARVLTNSATKPA